MRILQCAKHIKFCNEQKLKRDTYEEKALLHPVLVIFYVLIVSLMENDCNINELLLGI